MNNTSPFSAIFALLRSLIVGALIGIGLAYLLMYGKGVFVGKKANGPSQVASSSAPETPIQSPTAAPAGMSTAGDDRDIAANFLHYKDQQLSGQAKIQAELNEIFLSLKHLTRFTFGEPVFRENGQRNGEPLYDMSLPFAWRVEQTQHLVEVLSRHFVVNDHRARGFILLSSQTNTPERLSPQQQVMFDRVVETTIYVQPGWGEMWGETRSIVKGIAPAHSNWKPRVFTIITDSRLERSDQGIQRNPRPADHILTFKGLSEQQIRDMQGLEVRFVLQRGIWEGFEQRGGKR